MTGDPTPFVAFGPVHAGALLGIAAAAVILSLSAPRLGRIARRRLALGFAVVLPLNETVKTAVAVQVYGNPLSASLPLHLCGMAAFLTAWVLWRRSYGAYEVAYFWGVGGTVPALLTPDLTAGFPDPAFFYFFGTHGLILLGVLYATFACDYRPRLRSVGKTVLATLLLMLVITPVNLFLDANYMYLRAKPEGATLMDYLGPWPWYLPDLVVIGTGVCLLCYAPFAVAGGYRARSEQGRP